MKKKNKKKQQKKNTNILLPLIAGIILIIGIGYTLTSSGDGGAKQAEQKKLPSYAYQHPMTLKAYTYASTEEGQNNLKWIPCYCGCGKLGHTSVRDCFIHEDGTYEEHASYCDTCVGINIRTQNYLSQGMSLKEVREKIDEYYGGSLGYTPTDTPYPPT